MTSWPIPSTTYKLPWAARSPNYKPTSASGRGSAKSIGEQLKEVIDSANLLGYVKPEAIKAAPVVANATDAAIQLEMVRLQLQDKATERQFAWQMERDRRQWQLDLKKLTKPIKFPWPK